MLEKPPRGPGSRLALLAFAPLLACLACDSDNGERGGGQAAPKTSSVLVSIVPEDGATGVAPDAAVTVVATGGKLTEVNVTGPAGRKVTGILADDRSEWSAMGPLGFGVRYTVEAKAVDPAGLDKTVESSFTTLTPERVLHTAVLPRNGETVGAREPITVKFTMPVRDQTRAEAALVVESDPPSDGEWSWPSPDTARYLPADRWPAGATVTLHVRLTGVDLGGGVYGGESRDISFAVGEV